MYAPDDTIVALSSAAGASARGVIRLSGPEAFELVGALFEGPSERISGTAQASWMRQGFFCRLTDQVSCPAELYVFRGPNSYTGQDVAELHVPGSPALLRMVLEQLLAGDARMADPGEFTARAYFNGRMDLSEAEAVAAVIGARGDGELRAAERLLGGALHRCCKALAGRVGAVLALVEVGLDFSDQDIEIAPSEQLRQETEAIHGDIGQLLRDSLSWEQLTHLPQVVVAGPTNAGKSCLVNALLGFDRSIVAGLAGTTRDLLTAPLFLGWGECMLIDTAGLGRVDDELADHTQQLTREAMAGCDLLVWVFDISQGVGAGDPQLPGEGKLPDNVIMVGNKIDLAEVGSGQLQIGGEMALAVSALRGDNIDNLRQLIGQALRTGRADSASGASLALTARQSRALRAAEANLGAAARLLCRSETPEAELVALELRAGLDEIGSISGEVLTEDVLKDIFGRFCIGK